MDRLALHGMRVYGRHGVEPEEREREQPFDLDLTLELDLRAAQASDNLADTLDYAKLHARIVAIVASTSFALLERLAGEILAAIFEDERVARAEITIAKPRLLAGATPSVTLARTRSAR